MQRRPAKSAHISPPSRTSSMEDLTSPSDNKSLSRMQRRALGVSHRVWALLAAFLLILTLTRLFLPSSSSASSSYAARHKLLFSGGAGKNKPTNFLNATEDEAPPFEFCPVFGPGDELSEKYGSMALAQSRLHLGSGARVQRVVQKALLGLPVTFSVIGGSVSACHGAGDDPLSPSCYPALFLEWWNSVLPHPATEITNGAMRLVNSGYFGFCAAHHIPDLTDVVILELDTDDDDESLEHFELLVRSILLRADQPAVIVLGHFSPQIHNEYGYVGPDHLHSLVAQFYDVPHLSTKSILYPQYMLNPIGTIKTYFADPKLANPAGHSVLSDVLISYMQSQICAVWSGATGHSFDALPPLAADGVNVKQPSDARGLFGGGGIRKGADENNLRPGAVGGKEKEKEEEKDLEEERKDAMSMAAHLRVPISRIATRPTDLERGMAEIAPFCASANDLVNPLPSSILAGSGWTAVHSRSTSVSAGVGQDLYVGEHYWEADMPGARFHIPVSIGAGDVGLYYMKEYEREEEGSSVECFVDDNVGGKKRVGNGGPGGRGPTLFMFDKFVGRGAHTIECRLVGEEGVRVTPFKILGIFAT